MARHAAFSCLSDGERDRLLQAAASRERTVSAGGEIVRQGDDGDSCFLIGAGSVEIRLETAGGAALALGALRRGDVFGEMSVLDRKPRAATVAAAQDAVLLEIEGSFLREVIVSHPDLELALLVALTDKLRATNQRLLALHPRATDEAVKLLDARLSAEVRVFDATLKAAQAVFEQTKVRSDEVITGAERSRSRLITLASLVGTVIAFLGFFGVERVVDLNTLTREAQQAVDSVQKLTADTNAAVSGLEKAKQGATRARQVLVEYQLRPAFRIALQGGREGNAIDTIQTLAQLSVFEEDEGLLLDLLNDTEEAILFGGAQEPQAARSNPNLPAVLKKLLDQARDPKYKARAHAVLAATVALTGHGQVDSLSPAAPRMSWESALAEFRSFAMQHSGESLLRPKDLRDLEQLMRARCPDKLRALQEVAALVRTKEEA